MYIKYYLQNTEKIRITNDSSSHNEQTDTLSYIPGSTIRGIIINKLAQTPGFEAIKIPLFSDKVRYMNAYPAICEGSSYVELIPSMKGFYENKDHTDGKKKIENVVVSRKVTSGNKRASAGLFCRFQKDILQYMSPELRSDLRINTGKSENQKKNIFRGEYIAPGQVFCGFIEVKDPELSKKICFILDERKWYIGNSRSSGYGACEIIGYEKTDKIPYQQYLPHGDCLDNVYLYLASNTVMRNGTGEYTGLDLEWLSQKLGVQNLKIETCSTSTVQVCGYNRLWNTKIPSVLMYEMGSVFKLSFSGIMKKEAIDTLCAGGIGIRRNEGFGSVLILDGYEKIQWKEKLSVTKGNIKQDFSTKQEDDQVLRIAAKGYYLEVLDKAKTGYLLNEVFPGKKLPASQLGMIRALAVQLQYQPEEAEIKIRQYLEHAVEKDENASVHRARANRKAISEFINHLLNENLNNILRKYWTDPEIIHGCIMGVDIKKLLTKEEVLKWKLQLLVEMIQLVNREEAQN